MTADNNVIVNAITVSRANREVLHALTLEVRSGEIFGLLGRNGAGKSTLMSCLMGLLLPDEGTIHICGILSERDSIRRSERIALQPQDGQLLEKTTVDEMVALFASFYSEPLPVSEVLSHVGLRELASRRVEALSGGERRRLLIALAIVGNTPVVLLDEPTSGVDVMTKRALWELISAIRDSGRTVVLATHDMEEATALCDRLGIINEGTLVAVDTPEAITERASTRATISFTVELGVCENQETYDFILQFSPLGEARFDVQGNGQRVSIFTDDADAAVRAVTFNRLLRARNIKVVRPTLEDAFLLYAAPA